MGVSSCECFSLYSPLGRGSEFWDSRVWRSLQALALSERGKQKGYFDSLQGTLNFQCCDVAHASISMVGGTSSSICFHIVFFCRQSDTDLQTQASVCAVQANLLHVLRIPNIVHSDFLW